MADAVEASGIGLFPHSQDVGIGGKEGDQADSKATDALCQLPPSFSEDALAAARKKPPPLAGAGDRQGSISPGVRP
jgi:hypothetical protein